MKRTAILLLACLCLIPHLALAAEAAPAAPFKLVSAEKESRLRKLLPRVADSAMQALLDDDRLMLYTEEEMPRCHQDWDGSLPGIHSPYYNISADDGERFGNGNREFPWGHPAGTHRTNSLYTFRFLSLPIDEQGRPRPVVYYRKQLRGDTAPGYAWMYPAGTVFGEVLCLKNSSGSAAAFEIRVRKRNQVAWDVDVFRPFPTAESLAERIQELRPDWEKSKTLTKLVSHLTVERPLAVARLVNNHPGGRVIDQTMGVDSLPPVNDEKLVLELLTSTPFVSAHGEIWRKGTNATFTAAPTTTAKFHVVPAGYDAGFIEVDQHSCMRCHESANQHVRNFDFGRDWYGRVRGSDGIFSWHPFDPSSISSNGFGNTPRIRPALLSGGVLTRYNRRAHPAKIYNRIRGLDQ